jgi:hypothetical protein
MVPPLAQLGGDLSRFFGLGMLLAEQTKNAHHATCPIFAWMTGKPEVNFPIGDDTFHHFCALS